MNNPTIPLAKITEIMGRHFTQSLKDGGSNPDRVLHLFIGRVVDDLKREPSGPARVPVRSDD